MTVAAPSHIVLDGQGVPWIGETNIKVIEVAIEHQALNLTPEQIHDGHAGLLTLGQIHSALSWYHDHKDAMDVEIQEQVERYEQLRSESLNSPGRQKLRDLGRRS